MTDTWTLIVMLAFGTFAIRLLGFALGARLPTTGQWAAGFEALPGCLIVSLLSVILLQGSWIECVASGIALGAAFLSRSLPITMVIGIVAICVLRYSGD